MNRDSRPLTDFPEPGAVFVEKASGFRWSVGERLPDLGRLWISPVVPAWSEGRRPPEANLQPRRLKLVDFLAAFSATAERTQAPPAPTAVSPAPEPQAKGKAGTGAALASLSDAQKILHRKMKSGFRVMFGVVEQRFAGAETTTRYQHMLCKPGETRGAPVPDRTLQALVRKGLVEPRARATPIPKTKSLGHFERVLAEPYESYVLAGTQTTTAAPKAVDS